MDRVRVEDEEGSGVWVVGVMLVIMCGDLPCLRS